MLEIIGLEKSYGERKILEGINLTLEEGKTLAVIGPSGCGKSTLLRCMGGILPYDKGGIRLKGEKVENCLQEIGLSLQEHNLFPWLKVHKNLELGLIARKVPKPTIQYKVQQVANDLGLSHLLHCYPNTLSGGEKQRVAIGRILAYTPALLLLDEPSSALDAMSKEKFQDTLVTLKEKYPITTVIVTHSIEEAVYLGDYVMIMNSKGQYTLQEIKLLKTPSIRKEVAFFDICREVRERLEEGEGYGENK